MLLTVRSTRWHTKSRKLEPSEFQPNSLIHHTSNDSGKPARATKGGDREASSKQAGFFVRRDPRIESEFPAVTRTVELFRRLINDAAVTAIRARLNRTATAV